MFVVSSFLSDCHHTKAWTPHTLWLNYCSSILISLFPRVSWLIHYNVVHVSLLLKNLRWIQFSFFSLFERSFHHSRLLFFPLSFQYYFPLVLLSWLICYLWTLFIWILSVLFFLSTVYPYHHYLQHYFCGELLHRSPFYLSSKSNYAARIRDYFILKNLRVDFRKTENKIFSDFS